MGDEVEVKGLIEGREVAVDFKRGRQMGDSFFEERPVFRQGEGFNVEQGVEQASAETCGGFELGGPGAAPVFVVEARVSEEKRRGFRGEAIAVIFEEAGQVTAVEVAEAFGIREELHRISECGRAPSPRCRLRCAAASAALRRANSARELGAAGSEFGMSRNARGH